MSDKNDTRAMLLGASPWKLVLSLSVPAIIGMVVVGQAEYYKDTAGDLFA